MHEFRKLNRFIVVGVNGGFSNAISSKIPILYPSSTLVNISSREFQTTHFRDQTEFLLKSQNLFSDHIIWCSGSSSNRSTHSDCMKDESALREFFSIFLKRSKIPFHFSFLSSGGTVYGNFAGVVNEQSEINPQTAYAEMKIRSENYLKKLAQDGFITLSIFRLANVYGLNKPSNRMSFVEVALKRKEIFLTVNSQSRKQYGTYDDYAHYILNSLRNSYEQPDNFIVQNIFSDHPYSIDDILRLTASHNKFGEDRLIHEPGDCSILETVLLTSTHPAVKFNHNWKSLENYLEGVNF